MRKKFRANLPLKHFDNLKNLKECCSSFAASFGTMQFLQGKHRKSLVTSNKLDVVFAMSSVGPFEVELDSCFCFLFRF